MAHVARPYLAQGPHQGPVATATETADGALLPGEGGDSWGSRPIYLELLRM